MPEGQETFVTARVLGTFGYFDPEYTSVGIYQNALPFFSFFSSNYDFFFFFGPFKPIFSHIMWSQTADFVLKENGFFIKSTSTKYPSLFQSQPLSSTCIKEQYEKNY